MLLLQDLLDRLNEIAPLAIAEDWDNVGLLLGDPQSEIYNVMICLTITSDTVAEAIANKVDCIVVHHPIPFKPVSQITPSTSTGKYLWELASAKVSVYSPHTCWDNALAGVNQQLATLFQLEEVAPIIPIDEKTMRLLSLSMPRQDMQRLGTGRIGNFANLSTISMIVSVIQHRIDKPHLQRNQPLHTKVSRVAIVCGSGGSFVAAAKQAGADLLVTGEATYHQFLEATNLGMGLLTMGHYQSEGHSMQVLSEMLVESFPKLTIWRSKSERDAYCEEL